MKKILALVLAVVLVAAAAIGGTTAYFTDTTSSTNNIIATGTLNVELEWANGTESPAEDNWKDASEGAIFNNELWEPGYTEVRHIRISNEGTLALDYSVSIEGIAESMLAEAIEVYFFDPARQIASRAALANETSVGMLNDVLANGTTIGTGDLGAGEADTLTIALKMDEDAGNEYQNLDLSQESFSVVVYAEQAMVENDSFGNDYDSGAGADPNLPSDLPKAGVTEVKLDEPMRIYDLNSFNETGETVYLDVAFVFTAPDNAESVQNSPYKDWNADFVISFDKDVAADSAGLGGSYFGFENIAFYAPMDITANTPIRLLQDSKGLHMSYMAICTDVVEFLCGAFNKSPENIGTVMTVELNIYEVDENGAETGLSYNIGTYEYTFK